MQIKAVLFDLDGTLISSLEAYVDMFCECLREQGVEPESREAMRRYCSMSFAEHIQHVSALVEPTAYIRSLEQKEIALHRQGVPIISEVPGLFGLLQTHGIRMAIVSGKSHAGIEQTLLQHELTHFIDAIIGRDDVSGQKPNPEPVLRACELLNVAPRETLFVGDTLFDLTAAKEAGSTFVGVLTGATDQETFEKAKADYIFSHVGEVASLIERVND